MRAEEIISLLSDPSSLDQHTLVQLGNLVKEYPYFQAAHLLYVLNLQTDKDTRFQSELRKTACYAGDRKKLFFLVEKDFFSALDMDRLEKEEENNPDSSFDLIDFFLTAKTSKKVPDVLLNPVSSDRQQAPADYASYFLSEEVRQQELEVVPLQHQETIDKFLEEDKRSPIRIEWKEPESEEVFPTPDLDSVDENSFFSETLAKIYLKQKKYVKALEIIRKLNLVYPEKNIYFADQIRFLEKLIINAKKTE